MWRIVKIVPYRVSHNSLSLSALISLSRLSLTQSELPLSKSVIGYPTIFGNFRALEKPNKRCQLAFRVCHDSVKLFIRFSLSRDLSFLSEAFELTLFLCEDLWLRHMIFLFRTRRRFLFTVFLLLFPLTWNVSFGSGRAGKPIKNWRKTIFVWFRKTRLKTADRRQETFEPA